MSEFETEEGSQREDRATLGQEEELPLLENLNAGLCGIWGRKGMMMEGNVHIWVSWGTSGLEGICGEEKSC